MWFKNCGLRFKARVWGLRFRSWGFRFRVEGKLPGVKSRHH